MENNNTKQKDNVGGNEDNVVEITNYVQLLHRIDTLRVAKMYQEEKLRDSFSDVFSTLNLVSLFKETTNQNDPLELAKSGTTMVLNLIIDLLLGKHRSIKGYLSSIMVEKFTSMLINNNLTNILTGIGSLLNRKSQFERSQEF